jgi:hypothetical protein
MNQSYGLTTVLLGCGLLSAVLAWMADQKQGPANSDTQSLHFRRARAILLANTTVSIILAGVALPLWAARLPGGLDQQLLAWTASLVLALLAVGAALFNWGVRSHADFIEALLYAKGKAVKAYITDHPGVPRDAIRSALIGRQHSRLLAHLLHETAQRAGAASWLWHFVSTELKALVDPIILTREDLDSLLANPHGSGVRGLDECYFTIGYLDELSAKLNQWASTPSGAELATSDIITVAAAKALNSLLSAADRAPLLPQALSDAMRDHRALWISATQTELRAYVGADATRIWFPDSWCTWPRRYESSRSLDSRV